MSLRHVQLRLVDSIDEVWALKQWMSERRPFIAVDTETEGLSWWRHSPRLLQVGDPDAAWAIPWRLWGGAILEVIREFDGDLIMHNAGFDVKMFEHWSGVELPRHRIHDTRVQAHILNPNEPTGLKYLAERYVDAEAAQAEKALHGLMRLNGWGWDTVPIECDAYWGYACMDVILTSRLHQVLHPRVLTEAPRAYDLEMATAWVLVGMERRGMRVDLDYTRRARDAFQDYIDRCAALVQEGWGVRAGSNREVLNVLQRELEGRYEFTKLTPGGALSLDKEVMDDVLQRTGHRLAELVYVRRKHQKLASAYLENFLELEHRGRIHPSFNAMKRQNTKGGGEDASSGYGARTGRMSVSEPSLQNLPRRSNSNPSADTIRNCLTASDGCRLLMCDFDQIEFRLEAHFAEDPALRAAFGEGDFFVNLTRQIFNDPTVERGDPRRQTTKNAGYAKIYGAGIPKFAQTAGIGVEAAAAFMQRLDQLYPGMNRFSQRIQEVARERHESERVAYVRSPLTGRRYPADKLDKAYALTNYLIQGVAAEVLKMKNLELVRAGLGEYLVLNVHDEIILDVPEAEFQDVGRTVLSVMNDDHLFSVPLTASLEWGERWGGKNPVELG